MSDAMLAPDAVSVPCSCGAKLFPRHAACPACGTVVAPATRAALEARLEGTHPEYRDTKRTVRRVANALLVVGLLHVVAGVGLGMAGSGFDENVLIGLALAGCWRMAKRAPIAAMTAGLAIWVLLHVSALLLAPRDLLLAFTSASGVILLFEKLAVFAALIGAARAARRLRLIEQGLAA
jgi:hypothetical protein